MLFIPWFNSEFVKATKPIKLSYLLLILQVGSQPLVHENFCGVPSAENVRIYIAYRF